MKKYWISTFLILFSWSPVFGDTSSLYLDSLEEATIDTVFDDSQDFHRLFHFQEEVLDYWTHLKVHDIPKRYVLTLDKARLAAEKHFPQFLDETNYYFFILSYHRSILDTPFSLGKDLIDPQGTLEHQKKLDVLNTLIIAYRTYNRNQEIIYLLKAKYNLLLEDSVSTALVDEHVDLALAYYNEGSFEVARLNFKKAVAYHKQAVNRFAMASHQNNIGLTFREQGNTDSAAHYFKLAIANMSSVEDRELPEKYPKQYQVHFKKVMESNLYLLHWKKEPYDHILSTLEAELNSAIEFKEYFIEVSARKRLCEFYLYHRKINRALAMAESLQSLVLGYDFLNHHALAYILLGKCKLAVGETKQALELFDDADHITDSIRRSKAEQKAIFAATEYQTQKKEKELQVQRLKLSNQDIKLRSDQSRFQMLLVIALLLLAAIALTFFFYKKVKASNRVIQAQNEQTTSDLKTKELLLKEVNHRVKNNLQVVSGLLAKQAALAPEAVKVYLAQSQQRLESIALIHKRLYENEAFQYLEFKPLVEELVSQIEEVNHQSGAHIIVKTDIEPTELHIDIATPVSLILNELVNNAYKHAFHERSEGWIHITFKANEEGELLLTVSDNGCGIGQGVDIFNQTSLGMSLVKGLSWQIHGDFSYETNDSGSIFRISFNQKK